MVGCLFLFAVLIDINYWDQEITALGKWPQHGFVNIFFSSAQVLRSIYCTFQSTARQRDCRLSSESETICATRGRLGPSEKYLCSVVVSATVWKWQKGLWMFTKWRAILHTGMVLGKSCPLASVTSDGYGGWCCGGPLQFDDNLGVTDKILTYLLPRRAGTLDYKTGLLRPTTR